jgi:transcription elongation GreA/GreB family factor
MTVPNERRASNDRRLLNRRAGPRAERSGVERRTNGDRRTGLERRLAILSAEGQIHEALRLLTEVIDSGSAPDEEQRSLESAMVRLRYALDRLEAEES